MISVDKTFSNDIVKVFESRCIHIDSQIFDLDAASEDDGSKSYPVKIIGYRIDWIIQTPEGEIFLEKILKSGNLEFWKI